ncbi:DUF2341 domain-containing protein, partial [Candidatus Magnetobacterium casense]
DFWQESYTSNVSSVFWVEFDSIAASPSVTQFLMYYGNSAATSGSNGDNTFIFFDDFNDASFNTTKWDAVQGGVSEASGLLTLTTTGGVRGVVKSDSTHAAGIRLRQSMKTYQAFNGGGMSLSGIADSSDAFFQYWATGGSNPYTFNSYNEAAAQTTDTGVAGDTSFHTWENLWVSGSVKCVLDGTLKATHTTQVPNESLGVFWFNPYTNVNGDRLDVDWVFIAKYVAAEPSISSWGSQNTLPAPTGVSATDGTYTDKVVVAWTEPCGASGYYLYRGGTYVTSVAAGTVSYNDTGATAGTVDCGTPSGTPNIGYVSLTTVGEQAINASPVAYTLKSYAG